MRRIERLVTPLAALGLVLAVGWGAVLVDVRASEAVGDGAEGDVLEWRRERLESLTSSDGWLTLTGLFWLEEGENTCGSDPASDVALPASAPARLGVLRMTGGRVELEAAAAVTVDGERTRRSALRTDAEGEPTVVELGSVRFYLIDRDGRIAVRVKDSRHPALVEFRGLDYYPIDPRWRVEARFELYDPPKAIPVPTVLGTASEQQSPGAVVWRMAARDHRLDALPGGDGELFIVFGDETNGDGTYGGGRFLDASGPDADGRVVLDFNRAYNPPCAFTPYATCPLPPPQNKLVLAVRAGEKTYGDGH